MYELEFVFRFALETLSEITYILNQTMQFLGNAGIIKKFLYIAKKIPLRGNGRVSNDCLPYEKIDTS